MHDWNEELQSSRELPRSCLAERIVRDRMMYKASVDFLDAAHAGVIAIVNKCVPPLNPAEDARAHVFVHNSIFFSFGVDGREVYREQGGDITARASTNNELIGVRTLDAIDMEGLCTLATAVADYKGHRLQMQSIIPGVLHGENVSKHLYGSVDCGETIAWDEEFHALMCKLGERLFLKEHEVLDKQEPPNKVKLCSSGDLKGIHGSDGRRYVLDIVRCTPLDANFPGAANVMKVLRPELLQAFCAHKHNVAFQEEAQRVGKLYQEKKEAADALKAAEPAAEEGAEPAAEPAAEEAAAAEEADPALQINVQEVRLNPNVLSTYPVVADDLEEQEALVTEAATFLKGTVITKLAADLIRQQSQAFDGSSITQVLHQYGVNMRYLGAVTTALAASPYLQRHCVQEMIVRCAKHMLNQLMREADAATLSWVVSHFLNCLLGDVPVQHAAAATDRKNSRRKKSQRNGSAVAVEPEQALDTPSLWDALEACVLEKYEWKLEANTRSSLQRLPTLRALCRLCGVQVAAKDYNFTQRKPFGEEDIVDLFAVRVATVPMLYSECAYDDT